MRSPCARWWSAAARSAPRSPMHLAKAGWTDTVLLERDELTSGSTWHAAGLLPLFNMGYATSHIHDYSVKLYKTLEAETGLNAGFSVVGNLRMAQTRARMDEFELYATTAETVGIPYEWLTPARDRRALAAGAHRGPRRRALPSDRRLHQPRRRDPGHGQGRAPARGRDRAQGAGRRLPLDRVGMDRHAAGSWPSGAATSCPPTRPSRSAPSMW